MDILDGIEADDFMLSPCTTNSFGRLIWRRVACRNDDGAQRKCVGNSKEKERKFVQHADEVQGLSNLLLVST